MVSCNREAILYATADNEFKAYLNGVLVLSGNNWGNVYSYTIPAHSLYPCGKQNNFTIVGTNFESDCNLGPAGILYAIIQNDAGCYNCQAGQEYNFSTCSCSCI